MSGVGITWGTTATGPSGNGVRAGLIVRESLTATTGTYTVEEWAWTRWSCDDSTNQSGLTGFWTGSLSNLRIRTTVDSSWSYANQVKLASRSFTVNRATTAQTNYQTLTLSGVAIGGSGSSTVSVSWTVPPRAPDAPTGATGATPTADGKGTYSQALSWSVPSGATGIRVSRWDESRTDLSYVRVADLGAVSSWTASGLAPSTHYSWAVSAVNAGGESPWTYFADTRTPSNRPDAPSVVSGVVRSGPTRVSLVLPANAPAVAAVEVRWRPQGTTTWTTTGKLAQTSTTVTLSPEPVSGSNLDVQARIWTAYRDPGGDDDLSASVWSASASVKTSTAPMVTIASPAQGAVIDSSTLTVQVSASDPDGGPIVRARFTLLDDAGNVLRDAQETTSWQSWTWTGLTDGQSLTARVEVQDSDGIWSSPGTWSGTVRFVGPAPLTLTTQWDRDTMALLWTSVPTTEEGKPDAVSVDLFALVDGVEELVAEGLSPSGMWRLPLARLTTTTYRVVVKSALPSTSEQTVVVEADRIAGCRFVVNGGPGFGMVAFGEWNASLDQDAGRVRTLEDGWANAPFPTEVVRDLLTDVRQVSFEMVNAPEMEAPDVVVSDGSEFALVQQQPGDLWWRDPTGASWPCHMTAPKRQMHLSKRFPQISFTVTRVGRGPSASQLLALATSQGGAPYVDLLP